MRRWWVQCWTVITEEWLWNAPVLDYLLKMVMKLMKPHTLIYHTWMHTVHQMQIHLKTQMCTHFMTFILLYFHTGWSFLPYMKTHHKLNPGPWTFQGHGENDHSCEVMTSFWDLWPSWGGVVGQKTRWFDAVCGDGSQGVLRFGDSCFFWG